MVNSEDAETESTNFGQVTKPRWIARRSHRNWCRHLLKQWLLLLLQLLQLLLLLQLWRQVWWRWKVAMLLNVMLLGLNLLK